MTLSSKRELIQAIRKVYGKSTRAQKSAHLDHLELGAKEHLLVSKALPIFWAPHYFCACSDLSLLCEAYGLSTHSEV